jgi:asparagine synthase (glutamine-hydrolysing)
LIATPCVPRFNGMFAFALWDDETETLTLGGDRLGKKPLLYRLFGDGYVCFASELGALLEHPAIDPRICSKALMQFLSIGYVLKESCIIVGVETLPLASVVTHKRGTLPKIIEYWNLAADFKNKEQYASHGKAAHGTF